MAPKKASAYPFQVQAYRNMEWHKVSQHMSEDAAKRERAKIARCQPQMPHFFRVVERTSKDFIHSF